METEPRDIEDAEEDTDRELGVFPDPALDLCPISFLGHVGAMVVFVMPEGDIRTEPANKIAQLLKADLFNSVAGQSFLTNWRDRKDKFHRELAAIWFVRQCREAGYWDASRPQRGLGVWPGPDGAVVLHRGRELWSYGASGDFGEGPTKRTVAEAMRARSGPIWRLRAPAPAPSVPATCSDARSAPAIP